MSFNYTKEMVLQEFKDATAKDEKSNKKTYVNRINYLKGLKKFKQETPQYMRDVKISVKQFDNLISAWSAPNPRDAFYLKVFVFLLLPNKICVSLILLFYLKTLILLLTQDEKSF